MSLDLTFLGTGNAFAPGGLCWNGFLVDQRYLFEAPPQALMSLHRVDVDPNAIEAVVLSHHHGDHFLGLPFLLLHWKHRGRETPVTIVGPPQTEQLAREIGETVYPGLFENEFGIEWREVTAGESTTIGDLTVEAVAVEHDDRLSLNLGYHALLAGKPFAYTGDTRLCDAVIDLAQRADVLVAECASRDTSIPIHMNLVEDIPEVHAALPPNSKLLLTHIAPDVETNLPRTIVAQDFKKYTF
tara:strand:+ start:489 stop:1214 length:726 start_codon:yes stop_codon:yes gene_type:complete